MDGYSNLFILFILGLLGVIIAGVVAGFSPTLFIAQAAMTTKAKAKAARDYTFVLMAGVLVAVLVLLALFQTINLNTLQNFIDSAASALFISVAFNVIIGILFIVVGSFYIRSRDFTKVHKDSSKKIKKVGGMSAAFGLGFAKTLLSVSGATAVFIGGNLIANSSSSLVDHFALTAVFLAATIAPFLAVFYYIRKHPENLEHYINTVEERLTKVNYRLVVGVGAIILGSAILIFNIMMALFY